MHPMFQPENLYSFDDFALNHRRVVALCDQFKACRNYAEYEALTQKAHWFLCAFWHGARAEFEAAQRLISEASDAAGDRIGGAA